MTCKNLTVDIGSIPHDTELGRAIQACAHGCYQRNLIRGQETWSGSSLRGRARSWGGQYARSRRALAERLENTIRLAGFEPTWICGTARTGPRRLAICISDCGTMACLIDSTK